MAVVLTNGGEAWASGRMAGTESDDGRYVGWGTAAGTAAKGDTTLFTETGSRVAGTVTVTGTGATAKYQIVATLTAGGALAITNAGNFTLSSGGTLIIHGDHGTVNLGNGDKIEYTIQLDPA